MKRIIGGVTYNTDTSSIVARRKWNEEAGFGTVETKHDNVLYITRGGAFFSTETKSFYKKDRYGEWEEDESTDFFNYSRSEAQEWILLDDVEIVDAEILGEPPEAEAEVEADQGSTIYFRVPTALKTRIDKASSEAGLSANAWMTRCAEKCLSNLAVVR